MAKILMVASEATPFIKTGGLADVIGALPAALKARGEDVAVVLPLYRDAQLDGARRVAENLDVWLGLAHYSVHVQMAVEREVPYFFVDCPPLYARGGVYVDANGDFADNHVRFALLAKAAIAVARFVFRPQLIHCHDWQSALTPIYLHTTGLTGDPTFMGIKTLLTIHNLGYQGIFAPSALPEIGLDPALLTMDRLEFHGDLNVLKGGIVYSDALSTVSKGYAREIQTPEYGFGLDGLLRSRSKVLTGILNGVDYSDWNPETDVHLAVHYSAGDLSGKQACKLDLLREFGLPGDAAGRPLIGIVSRFATQKGFDLIEEVAPELLAGDVTLVALGTGEPHFEEMFRNLAAVYPGKVGVRIAYDNTLAHKIEAGADIFVMPSRYEPSGLNQMYSLRYGTIPVVRATGGLDDTIDEDTGFKFSEYKGQALLVALRDALAAWGDPARWQTMMRNGMRKDFSWNASAAEYSALYRRLLG